MRDFSNIIKEFETIVKLLYVKRIPKHEPTSSYYHLVGCIVECMLISDEDNKHVHDDYMEETALSSNVNDTNEDESKEIIVHKPLSENLSMDVSKSECNTVHETLSQNNSLYVTTNVITKMKYDENIELSVSEKGSSYFNIFECGRNLLDQMDVTYQQAFTASPVQQGLNQICPVRERYYDMMVDNIYERNFGSEGTINKE